MVDTFLHKSLGWDEAAQIEDPTDPDCILDRETAIYNQMEYGNLEFASECYEALFQLCAKSKIRDPSRVVSITSMRVRRNAKLEETDEKGSSIVGTCNREEFRTQPTNQIHPF